MADAWSEREIELIVSDYFEMLKTELSGQAYNKTEHRRRLINSLNKQRSEGSIERKHQNISAILIEMGVPYIGGYKPLRNYQRQILPDKVLEGIAHNQELRELLEHSAVAEPEVPTVDDILKIMESAPDAANDRPQPHTYERPQVRAKAAFDYLRQEAANAKLGYAGELLVINFEKARLIHAGKPNLADGVEHIAQTVGDGAGFDVKSYEDTGHDRLIEAKTTRHGKETPFYVTQNELTVSRERAARYWLYRVYRYEDSPRLYSLNGALDERFVLKPHAYMATGVA